MLIIRTVLLAIIVLSLALYGPDLFNAVFGDLDSQATTGGPGIEVIRK